jgi:hypothetical protein
VRRVRLSSDDEASWLALFVLNCGVVPTEALP